MKANEFGVVAEARRAAHAQLKFFDSMMAVKKAANSSNQKADTAERRGVPQQPQKTNK